MKQWKKKISQCGQIIVILAIVLVILLGFTAVAIDGSMIYSDRRYAQNAADAAALAGAGMAAQSMENNHVKYENFSCSDNAVINAMIYGDSNAVSRAATNGFTIVPDSTGTLDLGVHVTCNSIQLGSYFDRYLEYTVKLKNTTSTAFAHLFYNGPVENKVTAVVRVHPRTNLGTGYAIASLGLDCSSGGMWMHGNIDVITNGAGVFSNSCMDFNGTALSVTASDPVGEGIRYITTMSTSGHPAIDPWPVQASIRLKSYVVPAPDCASLPYYGSVSGSGTYNPGRYGSIGGNGQPDIVLNPGLYCLTGNLGMNNGTLTGNGVTFYFTGTGGYNVKGNVQVNLSAPTSDTPPAIRGMLMYMAGTGSITVYGTSDSSYTGTIYAPNGSIDSGGNSGLSSISGQLIGLQVTVGGTSDINLTFDSDLNYQVPATLDLMK